MSTVREKILLAAVSLGDPVDVCALVVRCWERDPNAFALRGYPQYPDAARVRAKLSGREGLCGDLGWMELSATNTYRVTAKGRAAARLLTAPTKEVAPAPVRAPSKPAPAPAPVAPPPPLTAVETTTLRQLAGAPAFRAYLRGAARPTEDGAHAFWGTRTPAEVERLLDHALAAGGAPAPRATLHALWSFNRSLASKFAPRKAAS